MKEEEKSEMEAEENRRGDDPLSAAVLRKWILSVLLVLCAAGVIATRLISGETPIAWAFLAASFVFYVIHGMVARTNARVPAFWLSLACSVAGIVLMALKFSG
ncbi:MAG TPA: hypothetical protein VF928_10565 [Usitatibacteraceae bacterium]